MSNTQSPLHPEVRFANPKTLSGFVVCAVLAAVGGFTGGYLSSYGPQTLQMQVSKYVFAEPTPALVSLAESPVYAKPPAAPEVVAEVIPTEPPDIASQARLVIEDARAQFIVLQTEADPAWGRLEITPLNKHDNTFVQATDSTALPSELREWAGRRVDLYGAQGYRCSATVSAVQLLERVAYRDQDGLAAPRTWMDPHSLTAAAQFRVIQGNCNGAIWARSASLPTPEIARVHRGGKKQRAQALQLFRNSASYRAIQEEFHNKANADTPWDEYDYSAPRVTFVTSAHSQLLLVVAQAGGCGDEFDGTLSMLFSRNDDGSWRSLANAEQIDSIVAAADMDGDGELELVSDWNRALLLRDGGDFYTESRIVDNDQGCGC